MNKFNKVFNLKPCDVLHPIKRILIDKDGHDNIFSDDNFINLMEITQIESRFKEISNLSDIDLSKSLIKKSDYPIQQVKTRKDKSKNFGEVFTPLFLVDIMIYLKFKELTPETKTCDLCAGYGQFTIRLMRILYNKFKINVEDWLKNIHTLTELQMESCAKLVYIFGPDINLYAGDSLKLEYSDENDKGILFYNEKEK